MNSGSVAPEHESDPTPPEAEKPSIGRRFAASVRRWGTVLIVFMGLNVALYVGHGILTRDDRARARTMEGEIARMDQELGDLATIIESHETEGTAIDVMAMRIQDPDTWYPAAADYEEALREHNRRVDAWNLEMPGVTAAAARHNDLVDQYNQVIAEYNEVIETVYARWWLLPLPTPSRAKHSTP